MSANPLESTASVVGLQSDRTTAGNEVSNIRHFDKSISSDCQTEFEKVIRSWTIVKPIAAFKPHQVVEYWKALITADTLKYRLCDVDNPGSEDIRKLLSEPFIQSYYVWDKFQKKITAEFMLEHFTGLAAQIHFSMLPANQTPYSIETATWVTNDILNKWTDAASRHKPFLKTLYGLTPVTNRVARLFVCKVGFRTVGVIPNAMMDRGKIVDAQLVIKQRTEHGRK